MKFEVGDKIYALRPVVARIGHFTNGRVYEVCEISLDDSMIRVEDDTLRRAWHASWLFKKVEVDILI